MPPKQTSATGGLAPPKVQEPRITTDDFEAALETYGSSVVLSGFEGFLDLDAMAEFRDLEISNCSIKGLVGSDRLAPDAVIEIEDSSIFNVDFSGWSVLSITGSEIGNSKLSGLTVEQSVNDSRFLDCKLDNCLIRFSSLKRVEFVGSQLLDADFHGTKFASVRFDQCKITGVGFDRCEVEDVDMRGSDLTEIADPRTLAGAIVDEAQVFQVSLALAMKAGLIVQD